MGDTHFRSNVKGHAGTEKVASMNLDMTGASNSYMKLGADLYFMWGALGNTVAIDAAASALTSGQPRGVMYLSSNSASGGLWVKGKGAVASWVRLNSTSGI